MLLDFVNTYQMKFNVPVAITSLHTFLRTMGYHPVRSRDTAARVYVRRAGQGLYPRFHIYAYPAKTGGSILYLHLDMKKPSYEGSRTHSGEYDSELVSSEGKRLRAMLDTAVLAPKM